MNAWPAEVTQTVEGWRLRFTQGVSRRANSAWCNEAAGSTPLAERIAGVEAFYCARRADACFHISPLSPPELDPILVERGYHRNGDTLVQAAPIGEVIAALSRAAAVPMSGAIAMHSGPTTSWEEVAWPNQDLRADVRRGILQRIGPESV